MSLLIALVTPALAGSPVITISGACPGTAGIELSGFTPGGQVAIVTGAAIGADPLPGGLCGGADTGLAEPRLLLMARDRGGDGVLSFAPDVDGPTCGTPFIAVDRTTCARTGVANIPSDLGDVLLHAHAVALDGGAPEYTETIAYFLAVGSDEWDVGYYGEAPCGPDGIVELPLSLGDGDVGVHTFLPGDEGFDTLAGCLTDGVVQRVRIGWRGPGGGGSSSAQDEDDFFGVAPDLIGTTVTRIDLEVDAISVEPGDSTRHELVGRYVFYGY